MAKRVSATKTKTNQIIIERLAVAAVVVRQNASVIYKFTSIVIVMASPWRDDKSNDHLPDMDYAIESLIEFGDRR